MKQLFLFDIDGTILKMKEYRSKQIFREAFREFFAIDVPESSMPNFSGMTDLQIFKDICAVAGYPFSEVEDRISELWEHLNDVFTAECSRENVELLPAISEMIPYLHVSDFASMALLTGNFRANAYIKLNTYDLSPYFPIGAFGCDHYDRNELAQIAIGRSNQYWSEDFTHQNSIILGDSPNDIICAKANNIFSVAVATGFHTAEELEEYKPDLLFESFIEYETKIETILSNL